MCRKRCRNRFSLRPHFSSFAFHTVVKRWIEGMNLLNGEYSIIDVYERAEAREACGNAKVGSSKCAKEWGMSKEEFPQ